MIKQILKESGYCVIKDAISTEWLNKIKSAIPDVFEEHLKVRAKTRSDMAGNGFAFHAPLSDPVFIDFLQELIDNGLIQTIKDKFFEGSVILNSFTILNNRPGQVSFATNPHRDVRFYTSDIPLMLNILVMLDTFTEVNGSTLVLPGSHMIKEKPSDDEFFSRAVKVLGDSGDVLLFNSSVWHAAGINKTNEDRLALALTFNIPPLKQLLDYPRGLGYERASEFNEELSQLLGYGARVPANLEEWYQPKKTRLYKKSNY